MQETGELKRAETSGRRKRHWGLEEKLRILEEARQPGEGCSSVARRHGVSPSVVFRWRTQYESGALAGVATGAAVVPAGKLKEAHQRIRELERCLGRKAMEVEILKAAVDIAHEKKLISQKPSLPQEGLK